MTIHRTARRLACTLALIISSAAPLHAACLPASLGTFLSPDEERTLRAQAQTTPFGQGHLYEARQGQRRIVILGTIHYGDNDPRMAALIAQASAQLDGMTHLLTEGQPPVPDAPAPSLPPVAPHNLSQQSYAWDALLTPGELSAMDTILESKGIAPMRTSLLPASLVASLMNGSPCTERYTQEQGVDTSIQRAAHTRGIPSSGLERRVQAPASYAATPPAIQVDAVRSALALYPAWDSLLPLLQDLYLQGESNLLDRVLEHVLARYDHTPAQTQARAQEMHWIVVERNRA